MNIYVSKVNTYNQCPRKYYYQHINRPKVPYVKWDHFDLGHLVHTTLELFHQRWHDINQDKYKIMGQCFADARIKEKSPDRIAAQAKPIIEKYLWKVISPPPVMPSGTEWYFNIPIGQDINLTGKIDRVDKMNNQYHLVDYKTGKTDHDGKEQLLTYAYSLSQTFKDIKYPIKCSLLLLKLDKVYEYNFFENDITNVGQEYLNKAIAINNDKSFITKPSRLCRFCDFKSVCEDAQ